MSSFVVRPVAPLQTRALRREVLRPHESLAELAAHERADGYWLAAFDGERVIGAGMIAADPRPGLSDRDAGGPVWRIRGMATAPVARGRGAGTAVLDALLAEAARQRVARVWANARTPAINLYLRAGFAVISSEFELPEIGPHLRVEREL